MRWRAWTSQDRLGLLCGTRAPRLDWVHLGFTPAAARLNAAVSMSAPERIADVGQASLGVRKGPEAVIPVIPSSAAYPGSFGQSRFPKALNQQLRV